ncbi:DMT family transporter [Geothermobacter hydrogeniphilus]|uniref:DMT family transporter n=1 Tax=Geothermobacter hydrogeniphilus TaxID=1969733 RepID=UPI001FE410C3|nr:DMT family transporter [Geothermobacter hydrogeniphilus]
MNNNSRKSVSSKVLLFTTGALVAFAGNSILCRLALGGGWIDAAGFTCIRLISGTLVLLLILRLSAQKRASISSGNALSAITLFGYAAAFSFAYLTLAAGTGALILFGAVQITMIAAAILSGERLTGTEYVGVSLAFGGLVYLLFPGVTAPSLAGSLLMTAAGVCWGIYSLRGRGRGNPLAETTVNFVLSLPLAVLLIFLFPGHSHLSLRGILLAGLSGGLASGIGYAVWYAAIREMTTTTASVVQLAVPVLAAGGGVIFLDEEISTRLIIATIIILGGISLAVFNHGNLPATGAPHESTGNDEKPTQYPPIRGERDRG